MGFRYPSHWQELSELAFDPALIDHDAHGFSQPFTDRQEDRDRYLEDYLDNLPVPGGGGKRYATAVVAQAGGASPSSHHSISDADYVCTGTNDDVTIAKACTDVNASGGGTVLLMEGEYFCNAANAGATGAINGYSYVGVRGLGYWATTLRWQGVAPTNSCLFFNMGEIGDFYSFTDTFANTGVSFCRTCYLARGMGIYLSGNDTGSCALDNVGYAYFNQVQAGLGIAIKTTKSFMTQVIGNQILSPTGVGIQSTTDAGGMTSGTYNGMVMGNTMWDCQLGGIVLPLAAGDISVVGNQLYRCGNPTHPALSVAGARNTVTNNMVRKLTMASPPAVGLQVTATGTDNYVTNNDLMLSGTTSFSDLGTGTITVAGNRL